MPATFASIQVGWTSPSPARTSPSAGSTPIPNRVPSRYAARIASTAGRSARASDGSPVAASCSPMAWTNHSGASTEW